jgi:hypothetical protein
MTGYRHVTSYRQVGNYPALFLMLVQLKALNRAGIDVEQV